MARNARSHWKTSATRENWTLDDTLALLSEGGALLTDMASNAKTRKQQKERGFRGAIMHLSPHGSVSPYLGRDVTVCVLALLNRCWLPCLDTAGHGQILIDNDPILHPVHRARLRRTLRYFVDRAGFDAQLRAEIARLERGAIRQGLRPILRPDGTSDLGMGEQLAREFPLTTVYDYTKVTRRMLRWLRHVDAGSAPKNYHLTFSRGARNESDALAVLDAGGNVAAVFDTRPGEPLPTRYLGRWIIDGDIHDYRFEDATRGAWVGLRAKGRARHDESGFVIKVSEIQRAAA